MIRRWFLFVFAFVCCHGLISAAPLPPAVLKPDALHKHVVYFNGMENETVINYVPNDKSEAWLATNIPLFECPNADVEEMYYFRWWALRKQLRQTADGHFVYTEFSNRSDPISSALGHHLMEGRWLRDQQYYDSYVQWWLRGNNGGPQKTLHNFSSWLAYALYQRYLVTHDKKSLTDLLDDLIADYAQWDRERQLPNEMYWQFDVRDAMEESISGSRTKKNIRPTINSYMFGNAQAIAAIARMAGKADIAATFDKKAADLKALVQKTLWDADAKFFEVVEEPENTFSGAREEIGFIPWYFELPDKNAGYEDAWAQLTDPKGFNAPFGITTAERRNPAFRTHGVGNCEWDGSVWPFATSQTLTALGNVLRDYPQKVVSNKDYYDAFLTYVKSQRLDGHPHIGEYLDETDGHWLIKPAKAERSRWYNHSTFSDLLITGLIGLRPRDDETVELNPLLPDKTWDWFCLDGVVYHGRSLTILWDKDGEHYKHGKGLTLLADGKAFAHSDTFGSLKAELPKP